MTMTDRTLKDPGEQDDEADVVVIGAGPVGLASALQLGRLGIRTRVFERRAGLSTHPKAGSIHAPTMEIFRRWGVADEIRAVGRGVLAPGADEIAFSWVTRLAGVELGRVAFTASAEEMALWSTYSPEGPGFCGQDLYEPILLGEAVAHPSVSVEFGRRAHVASQDNDSVIVEITEEETGRLATRIRARFVIAADGVRSPTRQALGVGETAEKPFSEQVNVLFRADLETQRAGRAHVLFWVVNTDTQGAFNWQRQADSWWYNFQRDPGEDPASYTEARCRDIIRKAVGDASVDIRIVSILHWKHDQAVTDRWRAGRVFFVGDSAHRFPPHGGFGMNSGVQDSFNLVWKIGLVLRGLAGDELLDTYEDERRPVAILNGEQSLANTYRLEETGWFLRDPSLLADIERQGPEGEAARARIGAAIPRQREAYYSFGQQFGAIYRSNAVIPDGSEPEPSTVTDYRITAHPGARAPHLRLRAPDGKELSTIDLFHERFILLAGPSGRAWREAAKSAAGERGLPLAAYMIGAEGDVSEAPGERQFVDVYGIEPDGAVLVRPDGHVAFRSRRSVADAREALIEALDRILSRPAAVRSSSRETKRRTTREAAKTITDGGSQDRAQSGEVDVVVIGAGPVGLATALQFGRLGIATRVFERRANLSRHPKAGGIHARTMEIFRRWGIAGEIREIGRGVLPLGAGPTGFGWVTRLDGIELGRIDFGASAEERALWDSYSPEGPCGCGQDLYEPILFREAERQSSVRIDFDRRAQFVSQDGDGVTVAVFDETTGRAIETIRARFVIAADGVRSPTRQTLGVGETGHGVFGNSINILFHADLERHRAGRQYGIFWVVNPDTQGAFGWRRQANRWWYNFQANPGEDPASYTEERCRDLIRKAIGDADAELEIVSILHWKHEQAVTDRWRVGRVFFVGDSAHRFPPHGGFGMNSGVQDSANLVWKIAHVLRGRAADALLDSYEIERKPVAIFNGEQSLINTWRMEETGWLARNPESLADIEKPGPEGQAVRDRIIEAIPRQREGYYSFGQQFGTIYRSNAVIADGSEPEVSTVGDYRITAHPGARAPHIWLRAADGREPSTIDLLYEGFVVLAGPAGASWRDAAERVGAALGLRLDGFTIGPGGDFAERPGERRLTTIYGIAEDGAVLVRPDGHVAFRAKSGSPDAERTLTETLERLLFDVSPVAPSPGEGDRAAAALD